MSIIFAYTPDDFRQADQLADRSLRPWHRALAGLLILNTTLYLLNSRGQWATWVQPVILLGIIGTILSLPFWWIIRRAPKGQKPLVSSAPPGESETNTLAVTPEGLHITNHRGSILHRWNFFHQLKEDERLWLLYFNDYQCLLLPKRIFADPAELSELRDFLIAQSLAHPNDERQQRMFGALCAGLLLLTFLQLALLLR